VIFKDKNKVDDIKYQRWPKHKNISYIEVNSGNLQYQLVRKLLGNALTNYFLIRRILKKFEHAICFEYYSALPVYLHSVFNKRFNFQIASLELYNTKNWLVQKAFQKAQLITTQDELRKQQLEKYYNLSLPSKVQILYNTSLSFEEISTENVEIPERIKNQTKILFIGSLISEHCIEDVIDWVEEIPENFCIIFHGWGLAEHNNKRIQALEKLYPHKVWLSNLVLDEKDKWKMYNIADFGIVMFNKSHRNNEYAGLSAGKLFDFIRVGVPVIVSDTKLLSEFVLDCRVGIVFNNFDDLNRATTNFDILDFKNLEYMLFNNLFYKVIKLFEK
jgi:glycosyltransferase involved in cell wall biosynthesis